MQPEHDSEGKRATSSGHVPVTAVTSSDGDTSNTSFFGNGFWMTNAKLTNPILQLYLTKQSCLTLTC